MVEVTIFVETEINPTEDEEKVRQAINNVLGNAAITIKEAYPGSSLTAEAEGQDALINSAIFCAMTASETLQDASFSNPPGQHHQLLLKQASCLCRPCILQ
jgi:predicted RNA binding protein with dsRBD fold (UPF0201 family)